MVNPTATDHGGRQEAAIGGKVCRGQTRCRNVRNVVPCDTRCFSEVYVRVEIVHRRFRAIVAGYEGSRAQPPDDPQALEYDLQHLQLLLTANTQDMLQHTVLDEDCKLGKSETLVLADVANPSRQRCKPWSSTCRSTTTSRRHWSE